MGVKHFGGKHGKRAYGVAASPGGTGPGGAAAPGTGSSGGTGTGGAAAPGTSTPPARPPHHPSHHHVTRALQKKHARPAAPAVDPFTGQVNHDTHAKFGAAIQGAKQGIQDATQAGRSLDTAYAAYVADHKAATDALAAQQQRESADSAAALNAGVAAGAQLLGGLANTAQAAGGTGSGEGAAAAIQGQVAQALQGGNYQQYGDMLRGLVQNGQVNMGAVMAAQHGAQAGQILTDKNRARAHLEDLRLQRGDFRAADRQKLVGDAADRQLAVETLLSSNLKSKRDYEVALKKLGLDKYLGQLTAKTQQRGQDTTASTAAADRREKHWETLQNNATKVQVSKISGSAGGSSGLSKSELHRTRQIAAGVRSAVLRAAQELQAGKQNDAHVRKVIVGEIGNRPVAVNAILTLAKPGGRLDQAQRQAIANLFPNGHIPGVLKSLLGG